MSDLNELPRLSESISYLYVERAVIEQDAFSVTAYRKDGAIPIPVSALTVLFLGPGTSVTHAAIRTIAESGCMVIWCGESISRFYASGMGETRSAANLLRQAELCLNDEDHMRTVRRMYEIRFPKMDCKDKTLQQIRGMEGIRVREAYRMWSKNTGISWCARKYNRDDWDDSDNINKALSTANTLLYGLCHAAIITLGYSPGLGFVHTGKQLSFVYDIADLYKAETTIPAAFSAVSKYGDNYDTGIRALTRQFIKQRGIMKRIAKDIQWIFESTDDDDRNVESAGDLWDDVDGRITGGINYEGEDDEW